MLNKFNLNVQRSIQNSLRDCKKKGSKREFGSIKIIIHPQLAAAFKLSTELVSAVAVGTIIGFILDKTFGTKPWLILIFFFVGVIAGITNVIKSAKNMQK